MKMEEKPFSCPVADCNMSFANEDHLIVHKNKHELSLSLASSPTFKNLVDQTPTPTRFLNALESLEFENPFDATFRRANSTGASSNLDIPESSSLIASLPDSEVLNTPSIILPSEPATPTMSTYVFRPNLLKRRAATLSINNKTTTNENIGALSFTPEELILPDSLPVENQTNNQLSSHSDSFINIELPQQSENYSIVTSSGKVTQKNESSRNVSQTSVITSVGNSSNNLKNISVGVPTAVVVTKPITISSVTSLTNSHVSTLNQQKIQEVVPAVVQPVCVAAPVVQLMIRLPDGQTVQLPIMASAPATQPPQTVTKIVPQVSSTTPNAKTKLKEVLTLNKKPRTSVFKETSQVLSDDSFGSMSSPPLSPLVLKHQGRRRRDISDPEDKKKRCLERNRAAATRCREKRKIWINSLEQKADELAVTNIQLQMEVKQLRKEVSNLKTMLLAHKDCPVTMQQQRAHTYEPEKEPCPVIHLISSSPEAIQQVPNSSDYLEMEVNSVQSSSDASSLTSDNSELSYRER